MQILSGIITLVITLMIIFLIVFGIPWINDKLESSLIARVKVLDTDQIYQSISGIKKELAKSFYNRHQNSKLNAYVFLGLTFFLLLVGSICFYFASLIAVIDSSQTKNFNNLLRSEIIEDYYTKYVENVMKKNTYNLETEKANTDSIRRIAIGIYYNDINDEYNKKVLAENENGKLTFWYSTITILSIRIMITIFVFFLSQIFLQLYRYNLRVSDFYLSKYDALLAYQDLSLDLETTIRLFEHKIDIGKEPKIPIGQLMEFIKPTK